MSTNEERGERSKAGGASGSGDDSPCQGGEGQSLSEPPVPPSTPRFLSLFFFFKPNTGFVHLGLWSRLRTLSPNSNCHSCLRLLCHAHVFFPIHLFLPSPSARCPWQPAVTGGRVLICDVSLCTEPVADTFVAVFVQRIQIDGCCCGPFICLEKAAALLTGGLCVKGVKTSPLDNTPSTTY